MSDLLKSLGLESLGVSLPSSSFDTYLLGDNDMFPLLCQFPSGTDLEEVVKLLPSSAYVFDMQRNLVLCRCGKCKTWQAVEVAIYHFKD